MDVPSESLERVKGAASVGQPSMTLTLTEHGRVVTVTGLSWGSPFGDSLLVSAFVSLPPK